MPFFWKSLTVEFSSAGTNDPDGDRITYQWDFDADGTVVSVAQWGSHQGIPTGARFALEGDSVSARVLRTGRPARMDDYGDAPGVIAATIRQIGIRFSIGVPISVSGRTWGVMIATSKGAPLPAEAESRLKNFTELVATAISNASAHGEIRVLADDPAAANDIPAWCRLRGQEYAGSPGPHTYDVRRVS